MTAFTRGQTEARRSSHRPHSLGLVMSGLAAIVMVGVLAGGVAFGYWLTTDGSNPGVASASTLSTPSVTTAESSGTSVNINWTAGTQPHGVQYVVKRTSPGSLTVCTTSSSSCQDSGLSPGTTYTYSVTAVLDLWQSPAGVASYTTSTVTITSPSNSSTFGTNWSGELSGNAAPATGTTISNVKVSVQQGAGSSSCWSGSGNAWTAICPNYVATGGTVDNWTLSLPVGDLNSVNTYHVTAEANDSAGASVTTASSFTFNSTAPNPAAPVPSATINYTDSHGVYWVSAETVTLTDSVPYGGAGAVSTVAYYFCSTSSCNSSDGTFIGNGTGGSWSYPWAANTLPGSDGTHYVVAVATDSLSNVGTSPAAEMGVDRTAPSAPTPSVNGFS
jgi:hypothetical protein